MVSVFVCFQSQSVFVSTSPSMLSWSSCALLPSWWGLSCSPFMFWSSIRQYGVGSFVMGSPKARLSLCLCVLILVVSVWSFSGSWCALSCVACGMVSWIWFMCVAGGFCCCWGMLWRWVVSMAVCIWWLAAVACLGVVCWVGFTCWCGLVPLLCSGLWGVLGVVACSLFLLLLVPVVVILIVSCVLHFELLLLSDWNMVYGKKKVLVVVFILSTLFCG